MGALQQDSIVSNNKRDITSSGRWGSFMKASAHRGLVVVDIAAVERDCAAVDEDATSQLPNNKARQ